MADTQFDAVVTAAGRLEVNDLDEYTFWVGGVQTAGTLKQQFVTCCIGTIVAVRAWVDTAPTGATFIVDVNKNNVSLFTTQGNRPTVAISGQVSTLVLPDITALAVGDRLSIDVDQVGSTIAGSNLSVTVAVKRACVA